MSKGCAMQNNQCIRFCLAINYDVVNSLACNGSEIPFPQVIRDKWKLSMTRLIHKAVTNLSKLYTLHS